MQINVYWEPASKEKFTGEHSGASERGWPI